MMRILAVLIGIIYSNSIVGQLLFSGIITEYQSGLPIAYASIGIAGKHYGTLSNEKGYFKMSLPYLTDKDTLKISAIGYETLVFNKGELKSFINRTISLKATDVNLAEVKVYPKKVKTKVLGSSKYSIKNCTAFVGQENNWKGEQVAIRAGNKEGQTIYIEKFNFYIIKNEFLDSIKFRLMLYEVSTKGYPSKYILKKPIIFNTKVKNGEVSVNLKDYAITTTGDFFISLECLEDEMDVSKFCFAGSISTPSFVKASPFAYWSRVRGGGADFNVTVSYLKD